MTDFITAAPFLLFALDEKMKNSIIFAVAALWILELFSAFQFGIASVLFVAAIYAVRFLRSFLDASGFLSPVLVFVAGVVIYAVFAVVAWSVALGAIRGEIFIRALLLCERLLVAGFFLAFGILTIRYAVRQGYYAIY